MFVSRKKKTAQQTRKVRTSLSSGEEEEAPSSSSTLKTKPKPVLSFDNDEEEEATPVNALLAAKHAKKKLRRTVFSSLPKDSPSKHSSPNSSSSLYSPLELARLAAQQNSLPKPLAAASHPEHDTDSMIELASTTQLQDEAMPRILDPAEIHALKKLRDEKRNRIQLEELTEQDDFVSLDAKSSSSKPKKESRLVSEDQQEDEPEPFEAHQGARIMVGIKSKDEIKQERKNQIKSTLIDMDQDENDSEIDQEDQQWQDDQIRKASSVFAKRAPLRAKSSSSRNYQDPDTLDGYDEFAMPISTPLLPSTTVLQTLQTSLQNLHLTLKSTESTHTSHASLLTASESHAQHLQGEMEGAKRRYTYYQDLVVQCNSFADLLDAKVPLFEGLVGELVGVAVGRLKEGEGVRYEEVEDGMKEEEEGVVVDAFGREVAARKTGGVESWEDVERVVRCDTEVGGVVWREGEAVVAGITEKKQHLLSDVSPEYKSIPHVLALFRAWKLAYAQDYGRSYAGLTVHQAVFPFVKMEICDWNPFVEHALRIEEMEWHHTLTSTSEFDAVEGSEGTDPLVYLVVKKAVFPHVKKLLHTVDLFSVGACERVRGCLNGFKEYASVRSVAFKGLVDELMAHVEQTVTRMLKTYSSDLTQPVSGPPAVSRRGREVVFWNLFKLFHNLFLLRTVLPKEFLSGLVMDTYLTHLLAFLSGPMAVSQDILKFEAIAHAVPPEWAKSHTGMSAFTKHLKGFAVNVVDRETERGVLDRVAVLLL
ncbi:GC-rich sequence DNA-binding factor 2 [Podochytrium sp. JEL0797]|nr:GC-rich sequence DNA-binding factor 2 [Podochytrium sp. JEL0797]